VMTLTQRFWACKKTNQVEYIQRVRLTDIDIVGRSQSAVRDAYVALEKEAAKVGLK
jgi:hypothetical protein